MYSKIGERPFIATFCEFLQYMDFLFFAIRLAKSCLNGKGNGKTNLSERNSRIKASAPSSVRVEDAPRFAIMSILFTLLTYSIGEF